MPGTTASGRSGSPGTSGRTAGRTRAAYGVGDRLYTDSTRTLADALAARGKTYDAQQLRISLKRKGSPKSRLR